MLITLYLTFFALCIVSAIIGAFFLKDQSFSILGLAGIGFIFLGIFAITDSIEIRTGSNVSTTVETFVFSSYPTTDYVVGLLTLGLGIVCLVASWKVLIDNKNKKYYEVEDN
jgi:hypothetical protein